ncbi:MAG: hypothetical protein LAT50_16615 [Ectothiorhodospiraceae bacterium]|nr:hypothetical protein [Ectothiorhodospiraceae bacterium]
MTADLSEKLGREMTGDPARATDEQPETSTDTLPPPAKLPLRYRNRFVEFFYRLFTERPLGAVGAIICVLLLLTGIFADFIAPHGYNAISPLDRLKPPSA